MLFSEPHQGLKPLKPRDPTPSVQFGFDFAPLQAALPATPRRPFHALELFAGAGGLALGLEKAGFSSVLLNDADPWACATLQKNRPTWPVIHGDVRSLDFQPYRDQVDVLAGGFPCQAFSYAGNKMGFADARGTLFYEYARAVKEVNPPVFLAENVRGLLTHDHGRTLAAMISVMEDLGYQVLPPKLLKAIFYRVPQKRERLILIGIRNDLPAAAFRFPEPCTTIFTVRDALTKGPLFDCDVPPSPGQAYPRKKAAILAQIPQGGYWRDLPLALQKEYMKKSFYLGGGKTGIARRLHWDEPSLTLTCAPAQMQTERCHPEETRPFTVREYARIQTFPDDWEFAGSMNQQYKQIGNAVPVHLGLAVGQAIVHFLNGISVK